MRTERSEQSTTELLKEEIDLKKILWLQIRDIMICGRQGQDRSSLVQDLESLMLPFLDKQYKETIKKEWDKKELVKKDAIDKFGKPNINAQQRIDEQFFHFMFGQLTKLMFRRHVYPQFAEEETL